MVSMSPGVFPIVIPAIPNLEKLRREIEAAIRKRAEESA